MKTVSLQNENSIPSSEILINDLFSTLKDSLKSKKQQLSSSRIPSIFMKQKLFVLGGSNSKDHILHDINIKCMQKITKAKENKAKSFSKNKNILNSFHILTVFFAFLSKLLENNE